MPRIALLVCFAALLCAAPAGATPGSAPVPFPASGQVLDAVVDGDTAYVAGYLRAVGSAPGPLTILNATGTVRRTFPEITSNGAPEELHYEGVVRTWTSSRSSRTARAGSTSAASSTRCSGSGA